jgi:hypothetical protein
MSVSILTVSRLTPSTTLSRTYVQAKPFVHAESIVENEGDGDDDTDWNVGLELIVGRL